jgi:hypothetical protein
MVDLRSEWHRHAHVVVSATGATISISGKKHEEKRHGSNDNDEF